ncbi:MAG: signal peptidase I [Candidatus Omnitrophica bacterium]|nr:signal peptidase I [Candidatus Omnitrophota bacterium]
MKEHTKTIVREWTESIIIAVILALVIRTFVVQAFKIPSGSMIPTLQVGDRIFVNKFLYGAKVPLLNVNLPAVRQPKRGDIVVFISTESPKKDFVKRLIAFEGEKVEIKDGKILINGKAIDEPSSIRSVYYYNAGDFGREGRVIEVPKDSYFVLGDNSGSSRDSRYWGFVPKKNMLGKVICIYWPMHRMKIM